MKTFEHITEKEILYHAIHVIYERLDREREILKKNPNSPIAKFRVEKFSAQYNEIHNRILEIERNERNEH